MNPDGAIFTGFYAGFFGAILGVLMGLMAGRNFGRCKCEHPAVPVDVTDEGDE